MLRKLLALLLLGTSSQVFAGQIEIHVATNGRESATGTEKDPFATIEQARDRIRSLRENGELEKASFEVLVHAGRYLPTSTIEFTAEDSGSDEFPILYRAVDGDVTISGGVEIESWQPLARTDLLERLPAIARGNVVCVSLHELGIDPGTVSSQRLHQPMLSAPMEIFADQQRLLRAGWPNQGWAQAEAIGPTHWRLESSVRTNGNEGAWAEGFWEQDWASSLEPVTLDLASKTVSLSSTESLRPKSIRQAARYRLRNLLGELDSPGEWFVDEATGLLLYWPVEGAPLASASVLDNILSIYDTEYVTFDGFRFESARSMNVEIVGGREVSLKNCHVCQSGTVAVHILGGSHHSLSHCEVSCTGSSAIRIEAGDRTTLEPCDHSVMHCNIHTFSERFLSGRAAIAIYGVGVRLATNHIHHGPDVAIEVSGNEHLIEHNEIAHVCTETDDTGAIHLGYDPTHRGNVIRKNYIHDLGGFSKTGVIGIYLDDFASGTVVENNLLQNTIRGIAIGGGRDNRIENNVIQNCLAPIQMDARGKTWARDQIEGESCRISKLCQSVLEDAPVFATRYPELVELFNDEPGVPKGNVLRSNSFNGPRGIDLQGVDRKIVLLENNSRLKSSEIANSETTLRELGIVLHTIRKSVADQASIQADR